MERQLLHTKKSEQVRAFVKFFDLYKTITTPTINLPFSQ